MASPAPLPAHIGVNFVDTIHHDLYPAIDATKSDLSQPSKAVLITGSGRGIGRSIALQYAKSGVGHIILCARTTKEIDSVEKEINAISLGVKVMKIPLDIASEEQVITAAKEVKEHIGRLDVLANNAGTSCEWEPITEGVASDWWWNWEVTMKGTYLMLKSFLPLLVDTAEREKTIVDVVNTSSIGAHMSIPGASSYQTSRLAMLRLSEFVMMEYGSKGVNCVSIHPGGVLTRLSERNDEIRPSKFEIVLAARMILMSSSVD
jgi:NAD(P)-dependent dehydrogenase (short-subunit alcohol dehydrogenase family)